MSKPEVLSKNHLKALRWFSENAGMVVPWTGQLDDDTLLFTKAKGIYKPKGSMYALSVRHEPSTHYLDQEPVFNPDGSWLYNYHQEEDPKKNKAATELYTNQGLVACMRDEIPVGVAIKISKKPNIKYKILGLAKVDSLKNGIFTLKSTSLGQAENTPDDGPLASLINKLEIPAFDPTSIEDARDRVLRDIVRRQGQTRFRKDLLRIYDSTCVITDCKVKSVLEAAHITPYLGIKTNHPSNGLLLRADIHTLWDLGLIGIDPQKMLVVINRSLENSGYEKYNNKPIKFSALPAEYPSIAALEQQLRLMNGNGK